MILAFFLAVSAGAAVGWCLCCVFTAGMREEAYRAGRRDQLAADAAARLEAEQRARREHLRRALYRPSPAVRPSALCRLGEFAEADQRAILDALRGGEAE